MIKLRNLNKKHVDKILDNIAKGTKIDGIHLLENYVQSINSGEKPVEGVEPFVINCLSQIVKSYFEGLLPEYDEIFCLKQKNEPGKRGRLEIPQRTYVSRVIEIGEMADDLMKQEGMTKNKVKKKLAKDLGASESTIRDYCAKWEE